MADATTCAVDGCAHRVRARGLCGSHYNRWCRERGPQTHTPCRTCGAPIPKKAKRGTAAWYCSDECRPRCAVEGCDAPAKARGYCTPHYTRWHDHGDPLVDSGRRKNEGACSVEDCDNPSRKRGWCNSHYGQWQRTGRVGPLAFTWATNSECPVCGQPTGVTPGSRRFCGGNCRALWMRYDGNVPSVAQCRLCLELIDLTQVGKGGKRRRAETRLCDRCRMNRGKHGVSVGFLANRDGLACGICSDPIDMTLRAPHLMRASVDHIIPRSTGGTNDPANLRLAHLLCNCLRGDKPA